MSKSLILKELNYEVNENFHIKIQNLSFKNSGVNIVYGKNNSGKTLVRKLLSGEITPDKGEVFLNQNKIDKKNSPQKNGIHYFNFSPEIYEELSVCENIFLDYSYEYIEKSKELISRYGISSCTDPRMKAAYLSDIDKLKLNFLKIYHYKNLNVVLVDDLNYLFKQLGENFFNIFLEDLISRKAIIIFFSNYFKELKKYSDNIYEIEDGHLSKIKHKRSFYDKKDTEISFNSLGRNGVKFYEYEDFEILPKEISGVLYQKKSDKIQALEKLRTYFKDEKDSKISFIDLDDFEQLFQNLDVLENILAGHHLVHGNLILNKIGLIDKKLEKRKIIKLLKNLGIKEKMINSPVYNLSSSEQKKIILIKAIITKPKLLVIENLYSNTSPLDKMDIANLMNDYLYKGGSILIFSQNYNDFQKLTNKIYKL